MSDLVVTLADIYNCPTFNGRRGFCARGARAWCLAHGIEWTRMVKCGIPAAELAATDDAIALRVIEFAQLRAGGAADG